MDTPWLGDACSLVDAFRAGTRHPVEELTACLDAIDRSECNAFDFIDREPALTAARNANVDLPFGGVPIGIKDLFPVAGWPYTEASLVFADRISDHTGTVTERVIASGAVPIGSTTSSEFGGINCTSTKLNGDTHNPWQFGKTPGGSSGGSAAAVAAGLVPIASGGDGGGSIRIPAGFTGLVGLKATFGRIPRGPHTEVNPLTVCFGALTRSVRDTARFFDNTNGHDPTDPNSLPKVGGWESRLGTLDLAGATVAVVPDLGAARVSAEVAGRIETAADVLIRAVGLKRVDLPIEFPAVSMEWTLANLVILRGVLGDLYPACESELTDEIAFALRLGEMAFDLNVAARVEVQRAALNDRMAQLLSEVDFIIGATNPDVAFSASGPLPTTVDGLSVGLGNNGALTIPSNIHGNPAISVPAGTVNGLPVGMQIISQHFAEERLLSLARSLELEMPWPLVAANAPC